MSSHLEAYGYRFGTTIGTGAFSKVVEATYECKKKKIVYKLACKIIKKSEASEEYLEKFYPRELKILCKLNHPNIITIQAIVKHSDKTFIFMIKESTDLFAYLKLKKTPLDEAQANFWFYQICCGLKYLHSHHYAHRDLKCENILISENMNIKLGDFGFARRCIDENNNKIMSSTFCGSNSELFKSSKGESHPTESVFF